MANGAVARGVCDEVTRKGVPVELTDDDYAQGAKGTVWYLGEATTEYKDRAKIVSLRERVKVPLKRYRNTLMTLETNPLEPHVPEAKYYARGVGVVLAVGLSGDTDREELIRVR